MRTTVIGIGIAALLAGCAGPAVPEGPPLPGIAFNGTITGKTLKYNSADQNTPVTAVGVYNPDGTLASEWSSGGKTGHYAATWKLDGDKVCVTSSVANGGGSRCFTWRKVGETTYAEINADGSLHGIDMIVK